MTEVVVTLSGASWKRVGLATCIVLLVGLLAAGPAYAATTRIEDTDSGWVYTGTWATVSNASHSGGTMHLNTGVTTPPGTAQISFTGTDVNLVFYGFRTYGIAAVSIDGGPDVLVDMYRANGTYQNVVPIATGLANTSHTLTIRNSGTRNPLASGFGFDVDAIDVTVPDPPVVSTPASSPWSIALGLVAAVGLVYVFMRRRTA